MWYAQFWAEDAAKKHLIVRDQCEQRFCGNVLAFANLFVTHRSLDIALTLQMAKNFLGHIFVTA